MSRSASPGYCQVTLGATNSSLNISYTGTTAIVANGSTLTWTPTTYYSFDGGTTQTTASATVNGPGTYSKSPGYLRASTILAGTGCSANRNDSTYYASGTTVTFTADANHSFGGSSTGDTQVDTIVAGATHYRTPGYTKITVTGTRCSITVGSTARASGWSGLVANGTTITWTADSGYAFSDSASATTKTATVAVDTLSYGASADYKNIIVSAPNGSANVSSGYRKLGNTITWTGSSGTNYKYGYGTATN